MRYLYHLNLNLSLYFLKKANIFYIVIIVIVILFKTIKLLSIDFLNYPKILLYEMLPISFVVGPKFMSN